MGRIWRSLKLGMKSLLLHKLRSGLTVLGIVFGVAPPDYHTLVEPPPSVVRGYRSATSRSKVTSTWASSS